MIRPVFVLCKDQSVIVEVYGQTGLEAIDVSAGEYPAAFDLAGQRIVIAVDGHPVKG